MKLTFSPLEIYKYMNDDNNYYPPNIIKESTGYCHDGCPYPVYKLKCTECGNECLDDEFEDRACNCDDDSIEEPNNQN